jgi:hypothetical protein
LADRRVGAGTVNGRHQPGREFEPAFLIVRHHTFFSANDGTSGNRWTLSNPLVSAAGRFAAGSAAELNAIRKQVLDFNELNRATFIRSLRAKLESVWNSFPLASIEMVGRQMSQSRSPSKSSPRHDASLHGWPSADVGQDAADSSACAKTVSELFWGDLVSSSFMN